MKYHSYLKITERARHHVKKVYYIFSQNVKSFYLISYLYIKHFKTGKKTKTMCPVHTQPSQTITAAASRNEQSLLYNSLRNAVPLHCS